MPSTHQAISRPAPAASNKPPPTANGRSTLSQSAAKLTLSEKGSLTSGRKSTPDSEALASSDDEQDMVKPPYSMTSNPPHQPPARRASWLDQVKSGPPRRGSAVSVTSSASATAVVAASEPNREDRCRLLTTHPTRPPASNVGINTSPIQGFPFHARAAEPFTSPSSPRSIGEDNHVASLGTPPHRDASLPFSIPLQPTPKPYRSLSYSVGQMEADAVSSASTAQRPGQDRQRTTAQQALLHRPSRPSMLTQVTEGSDMTALREENDDDSPPGSDAGVLLSPGGVYDRHSETSPNPLLRQATTTLSRARTSTSAADFAAPVFPSERRQSAASEDADDAGLGAGLARRFSEIPGLGAPGDGTRRGHWQSSLGFGYLPEDSQSRRHSLADLPTRRSSLAAAAANDAASFSPGAIEASLVPLDAASQRAAYDESHQRQLENRHYASTYLSGVGPALRSSMQTTQTHPSGNSPYSVQFQQSPAQGLFTKPGKDTKLLLVSFKCSRCEVYYVAEDTGLQVKKGDLVIVEADRGWDLGTVMHDNLSWFEARRLKEHANEQHYRWLMMFSQHNQTADGTASTSSTGGMMLSAFSEPRAAMPALPNMNPSMHDVSSNSDIRPKMVRRLAQSHEVAQLRDKEGNEAKAKRICQQKVREHGLDMEVLDAEFQMDWKKLTFFYFAKSYVNFNLLVTELFKVYKTRIWMSAVNPASLAAPLPPPSGVGAGALEARNSPMSSFSPGSRQMTGGMAFSQDPDPAGAVPPQFNPTTNSYYLAQRMGGDGGFPRSQYPPPAPMQGGADPLAGLGLAPDGRQYWVPHQRWSPFFTPYDERIHALHPSVGGGASGQGQQSVGPIAPPSAVGQAPDRNGR